MQYVVRMLLLCTLLFSPLWVAAGPVDINSADAQALDAALQGVGPKKAEAIVGTVLRFVEATVVQKAGGSQKVLLAHTSCAALARSLACWRVSTRAVNLYLALAELREHAIVVKRSCGIIDVCFARDVGDI